MTRPPTTADVDDGFRRLHAHARFREVLAGPAPRRPRVASSQTSRVVFAALTIAVSVPISVLAVFGVFACLAQTPGRTTWIEIGTCVVFAGVAPAATILAWRSLRVPAGPRPDGAVWRTAARIVGVDPGVSRHVVLQFGDGTHGRFAVADDRCPPIEAGLLGVASLLNGRLVDFDCLLPEVPPPHRARPPWHELDARSGDAADRD